MGSLKEREKEFKKRLIAEAAYELLANKPYESVTVDDIARRVGCGKGTLYMYFENKDHILSYLVAEGLDRLCAEIERRCLNNIDVLSAIDNYLTLQYKFYLENHQIFSSWLARRLSNSISGEWIETVHKKLENKIKMISEIIEKAVKEKRVLAVDSVQLAELLENMARASAISYVEGVTCREDQEKALIMMKDMVMRGIIMNKS